LYSAQANPQLAGHGLDDVRRFERIGAGGEKVRSHRMRRRFCAFFPTRPGDRRKPAQRRTLFGIANKEGERPLNLPMTLDKSCKIM